MADCPHPELRIALKRQADSLGVPEDKFNDFIADFYKRSIASSRRAIAGISSGLYAESYPGEERLLSQAIPRYQAAYEKYASQ